MQFIESSVIGLRAACHVLRSPEHGTEICLFPMIHIGTANFYAEVRRRLETCDLLLFEGVKDFRVRILAVSYSIAARSRRLNLVTQRDALVAPLLQQHRIRADVSAEQFAAAWRGVPWYQRLGLLVGAPVFGCWVYLTASRESIGRRLSTEEVESNRDFEMFESVPELENVLSTTRNARLIEEIAAALSAKTAKRIGILYGAAHMRAVSRLLTVKYKYRIVESEWVTVFDYPE
jgi:hypothetical protein